MDMRKMTPVIAMIGVLIFFIWGYLDTFEHSWLTFIAVGIIIVAISIIEKDKRGE
ncbi:MAG: hypothetical protein IJT54_00830 [Candidatus Methanomethylophilaceae archaeon]|nr:hypothetical protein [Candidatus Methanomethylophilaceae archaeon]